MVPFLVKKGVFWAVLGVFRLPDKQDVSGRAQNQEGGQSEAEFGAGLAFIYIHNRENICISIFEAVFGVFRLPDKQDVSGKGAKQDGGPSSHRYFVLIYNRSHRGTFANL